MPTKSASVVTPLLAIALTLGCGGDASKDQTDDQASNAGSDVQQAVEDLAAAFVPRADQFGVEQFKVVYDLEGQETGTRTMWVEDFGARVGIEDNLTIYNQPQHKLYYWDGDQGHMKDLPDGQVSSMRLRMKSSEPTSFATTPGDQLQSVGYEQLGEKDIVGITCEHWKNDQFNYEGCRWKNIELEFLNGAGTEQIIQRSIASEYVEGEAIPERIKAIGGS